jgi:monofunctional biosynthetic peptidoglycan transglycosylase
MTSASPVRRRILRVLRIAAVAVVALLLLPYVVAPFYRFVDPVSTLMLWRWVRGQRVERTVVPLDRMAPILVRTVISSEDARFCSHHGIDWQELQEVIDESGEPGAVRGGSTITQQVAKNLFLWPGRSFVRKALEVPLALWVDLVLGKRRVMEIYLNVAEWGPNGEFGAEAGARRAFSRSAHDLNASQAALLASVLPNPIRRSAKQPRPALRRLAGLHAARAAASPSVDACVRQRRTP